MRILEGIMRPSIRLPRDAFSSPPKSSALNPTTAHCWKGSKQESWRNPAEQLIPCPGSRMKDFEVNEGPDDPDWLAKGQANANAKVLKKTGESKRGENGFEQWGGYMEAKKAKLDAQINHPHADEDQSAEICEGIFKDVSIHINGYTNPPDSELRKMFVSHGGKVHPYRNSRTSFVIATNLSVPSKNLYGAVTLKPEWITESIAAGKKLGYRQYLLYNLNEENKQKTLTQMMVKPVQKAFGMATSRGRQMLECAKKSNAKKEETTTTVELISSGNDIFKEDEKTRSNEVTPVKELEQMRQMNNTTPTPTVTTSTITTPTATTPKITTPTATTPKITTPTVPTPVIVRGKKFFNEVPKPEEKVDIDVLRELPIEIAREVAQQYSIDISELEEENDARQNEDENEHNDNNNNSPIIAENLSTNPYAQIDSIDPSYLSALPDAIRSEVLLQFQEAKGNKSDIRVTRSSSSNGEVAEPQPCSSATALATDQGLKSIARKKPIKATAPCYVAPLDAPQNIDSPLKFHTPEKHYSPESRERIDSSEGNTEPKSPCNDGSEFKTPPVLSPSSRNSTGQKRFRSRVTPLSTRRKLHFPETTIVPPTTPEATEVLEVVETFDADKFWKDASYKPYCDDYDLSYELPLLNGLSKVDDVRDLLRNAFDNLSAVPEDIKELQNYFCELVTRGFVTEVQILLKFLCRKYKSLPKGSHWLGIIAEIVSATQDKSLEIFDHEINIDM